MGCPVKNERGDIPAQLMRKKTTFTNVLIGALCLEFTAWGSWQVYLRSHRLAVSRSKDWHERSAGEKLAPAEKHWI